MKIVYKIYKVDTINVDVEEHSNGYYAPTLIRPTVLREVHQEGWSEDTFNTEAEAEQYIEKNLVKEWGDTYTIVKQYSFN